VVDSFSRIGIGLIGAGRIGTSHAQILAERVPGARLAMVADPRPDAARSLADHFRADAVVDPSS
jgi:myo-inositol 2-dehydrogenase / D-chiro-inositol 1-dehydrogenase